jgi:glycosyltransferase involved in cell wall biosynthesis
MEKVDILLATYNGEKYLQEQIESILNQTYTEFRLLISDDGSKDNTTKIIKSYAEKDNRIITFFHDENLGVIKNFEFLMKQVESKYFMFSDQDDIWKEHKIEKSVQKIEEGYGLVYSDLEVVDNNLNIMYSSYWKLKGFEKKIKKYNNFESLYLNNYITGCTIISKKEFIEKVLPIPKNTNFILHDYWLPLMVSQNNKIAYIEEPLIKYRQHKNNKIGSQKKSDTLKSLDEIRELFLRVKIEHFTTFIENEEKFEDKYKDLSKRSLDYFKGLEKTKNFNFKNWNLFFKLYRYEKFSYTMQNFVILNLPAIARILFKLKKESK